MSIISVLAARYSALDYAYGISPAGGSPLQVGTGNSSTGATSITLVSGNSVTAGGLNSQPIQVTGILVGGTPITVGIGANAETVTPTAVSYNLSGVQPSEFACSVSATFANIHGPQEPVTSGTFGLQEAINAASGNGGGTVVITKAWYNSGGTTAIVQAAFLPSNGTVVIEDQSNTSNVPGAGFGAGPTSLTVLAAPSAATSATVASLTGVTGTWTAITEHVLFTYVAADGGETIASSDYSFTATASLAIGGSGPAAETGAVGYRVYIGANATTTCYMVGVSATTGTVIQCGAIAAFKIGTPFVVAAVTTSATNLPPLVQNTAFPIGPQPIANPNVKAFGPYQVTGVVTAGTAIEWGHFSLPAGFLNYVGRTIRIKAAGYYTPVSTATLILTCALQSVYGTTSTTIFTVTTPATSGTAAANINLEIIIRVATTGAAGTVECHGTVIYGGATGTAGLMVSAGDSVQAVSSAANLTTQDDVVISINSGTANLTQSQLRLLTVETLI